MPVVAQDAAAGMSAASMWAVGIPLRHVRSVNCVYGNTTSVGILQFSCGCRFCREVYANHTRIIERVSYICNGLQWSQWDLRQVENYTYWDEEPRSSTQYATLA